MSNTPEKPADAGPRSSDQLGLVERLRNPWHHADCREAADEIERLRSELAAKRGPGADDSARMDWLSTGDNYLRAEEHFYPADGVGLRAFIDWCMAGNEPGDFEA
jgi:hypothetical protein